MEVNRQYANGLPLGLSMEFGKGLIYIDTDQYLRAEVKEERFYLETADMVSQGIVMFSVI